MQRRFKRKPLAKGGEEQSTLAAAYVRMSTDHQKYSTENQLATIRRYAEQRGFNISAIYEDSGRSGLTVDGRDGLQQLMNDVQSSEVAFKAILVYDVSRWGRFQDADEGAYYEHICSRAGIRVHYCGEQFDNDGSIGSTLLKSVKRVMAGEYSRELSVKVFAGQCRLVELGFRQGGPAGYGLRRQLIDENRQPKGNLERGQQKSLQTDRVVLSLGPPEEIETVRRIYRLFVEDRLSETEIADIFNREGIHTDLDRPWSRSSIHQILTNEKYIGNNVFNRVSYKLKQTRVVNHPDTWVRARNVYPSVIDQALFERARAIINDRSKHYTDEELLSLLQTVLRDEGYLSGVVIDERPDMPSSSAYRYRFGSLVRAYSLIGFVPERDYRYIEINRDIRALYPTILNSVVAGFEAEGGTVKIDPKCEILTINDEFSLSVIIARSFETSRGSLRWRLRFDTGLLPDLTVAVRLDRSNNAFLDYYVFPSIDLAEPRLRLSEDNSFGLDAYRFDNLEFLYSLAERRIFGEAA